MIEKTVGRTLASRRTSSSGKNCGGDFRAGRFPLSFCHEGGADFSQGLTYWGVRALRGGAEEEVGSLADLVFPCVDLEVEVLRFAGGEGFDPL